MLYNKCSQVRLAERITMKMVRTTKRICFFDFFFYFETPEQAERDSDVFKAMRIAMKMALNT